MNKNNFIFIFLLIFLFSFSINVEAYCSDTCQGFNGDSLLKCAEKYCSNQKNIEDKSSKEECIRNQCHYKYDVLSCDEETSTNGQDTFCSAHTSSNKKTCEIINRDYYSYKVECSTTSNVKYPSTLPKSLSKGEGFRYQVAIYGNKSCHITFDDALWKFNYASSYNDSERENYLNAIEDFNKLNLKKYNYDSASAEINIKINERKDGKVKTDNNILEKSSNYYVGSDEVVSTHTDKNISSYHNNSTVTKKIKNYVTDSSNGTYYNLPSICISPIDNLTIIDGNTCKNGLGPYNNYFTSIDTDSIENDVEVFAVQNSSGLDVNNTCNYTVSDNHLACYIDIDTGAKQLGNVFFNNEDINFNLLTMTNDYDSTFRYNIGLTSKDKNDTFNNQSYYSIDKNSVTNDQIITVYGTVTDGERIAHCQKEVTVIPSNNDNCEFVKSIDKNNKITLSLKGVNGRKSKYYLKDSISKNWLNTKSRTFSVGDEISLIGKVETSTGTEYCTYTLANEKLKSCTNLYKPAEYQKIKDYCFSSWDKDIARYSSYDDCYNGCTIKNKCKMENKCYETSKIRQYCQVKYQVDGYNSISNCINDCSCGNFGVKYYYRTIAMNNPFVNREAGYNWLGYENYIIDDETNSTDYEPEYEIVLDNKRMQAINNNTNRYNAQADNDAYGDYLRDGISDNESYNSKFIHSDNPTDGGFKSYFTYIEGTKTGG